MAFNPFVTFQKNRRFWMAAILMVCMVTFVFCTGMKGDMQDRLIALFGNRGGPTVFSLDGRSVGRKDLDDLKMQRNLANDFMKICADVAFKRISKILFEEGKKAPGEKEQQERKQRLTQLEGLQATIAFRKSRPRYFDGGVKFDDLVEFKLWQAEADRLGVRIEDEHLNFLFRMEFFNTEGLQTVGEQDLFQAQQMAARNAQNANNAMVRRAVAEEFRVKITQYAVLGAQPNSWHFRRGEKGEGFTFKLDNPGVPDEVRGPMTLAQMWDSYKTQRSEFDVALVPVHVKDWLTGIPQPDIVQKRNFFKDNKDKPNDPSSEFFGLETPPKARVEFVYADPKSPAYLDVAKLMAQLKRFNPIALDVMQSPLVTAARVMAIAENDLKGDLQRNYDRLGNQERYHRAAFYGETDFASPILAWYAENRYPESIASTIGASALSPINALEIQNALSGRLAWGAMGRPAADPKKLEETRKRHEAEVEVALQSEARRRSQVLVDVARLIPLCQFPLDLAGPYLALDSKHIRRDERFPGFEFDRYYAPRFTIETVESEIREMIANRTAEAWAQADMEAVRTELAKAGDPEQFKRSLKAQLAKYNTPQATKLTYGPPAKEKNKYHSRFNVDKADELNVIKDSYLKTIDMINMFEARDLTPERLLKPGDYWKLFFDGTESFAATSTHRAMPWPPEVKPNPIRVWQKTLNPRLVNEANINVDERLRFNQHLANTDPTRAPENIDLFKTAAKPILFWRTAELPHNRQPDYDGIEVQIKKLKGEIAKLEKTLQANPLAGASTEELRRKETEVKDLTEMLARVVEGWQLEQARTTAALPEAKKIALRYVGISRSFDTFGAEAKRKDAILLPEVSSWQRVQTPNGIDYFEPNLPKDKIEYPTDDMIKNILSLYDLNAPITTGFKELDAANKELFEEAKKHKAPGGFVQILSDKPRRIFYIAAITNLPKANEEQFKLAMLGSWYEINPMRPQVSRDHFAERAQEQEARRFRQEFITSLKSRYRYSCEDEEKMRKDMDERGGGD